MNNVCSKNYLLNEPFIQSQNTLTYDKRDLKKNDILIENAVSEKIIMRWPKEVAPTATAIFKSWSEEQIESDTGITVNTRKNLLLIKDLGWTPEEALEARLSLISFEEGWNAPGMENYDDL